MEITEVRIKLMEDSDDRLQGFCSITFDNSFVVRDLKIIEGASGPFVAMPSRKLTGHCHHCGSKNHLKAAYCNQCGSRQREAPLLRDADGRAKLYADIAHPINSSCREMIQHRVIAEFRAELDRAKQPGYTSRYDDDYDDDIDPSVLIAPEERTVTQRPVTMPTMPAGTHLQPAEAREVPQPHITTVPAPRPSGGSSQPAAPGLPSGEPTAAPESAIPRPHLPATPPVQPTETKSPKKQGEFGAGIF